MEIGRESEKNTYGTFRKWLQRSYESGIVSADDKEAAIAYVDETINSEWNDERPALEDDETQLQDVQE